MWPLEEHSYPDECVRDRHAHHQILLGLEGAVDIDVEGRGGRIRPGGICVIPAEAVHDYLGLATGNRCRTLNLDPQSLSDDEARLFDRIRFRQTTLVNASYLNARDLLRGLADGTPLTPERFNLARLAQRVTARLDQHWTLKQLADTACVSERQLRRLIRRDTGLSPQQWLTRVRLDAAASLVREGRRSITEIALDCGFQSPAHFSRRFRERTGRSPRQWRSMMAD